MTSSSFELPRLQAHRLTSDGRELITTLVIVAIGAVLAAAAVVTVTTSKKEIMFAVAGGGVTIGALLLSGNPRLSCLWGLLLTAPFDLSKRFAVIAHMGGASAYRIDLCDAFLIPLLIFQIRDIVVGIRHGYRMPRLSIWWLLMIGLGVETIVFGPLREPAGHEVAKMLKCWLLCLVLVNEVVRVKQFKHVALALMLGVLLESCIGLVQYLFNLKLGLQALGEASEESVKFLSEATYLNDKSVYRVGALLGHPNLLAAYFGMLIPIGLALMFAQVKLWVKILFTITILLGEVVLVITLSRTGWIEFAAAFLGVIFLTFLHPRMRIRYMHARALVLGGIAVLCIAFSGPIIQRIYRSDPNAWNVRVEWIEVSRKMIYTRPVLGFGLNSFVFAMPPYTKYGGPQGVTLKYGKNWPVVHNIYALTWVEQGTVGFAFFVLLHVNVLIVGFKNLRVKNDVVFAVNIGALCGFVAIIIDGGASFGVRMEPMARTYWTLIALICAADAWRRVNERAVATAAVTNTPPVLGGRLATDVP